MFFVDFLGWIMKLCYNLVGNYGLAIIIFTIISRLLILPVTIWVQKNSIKMVKMMPAINRIKIKFFGDKDTIAEEEAKIYKEHKYNPFASIVPLIIQILLLICVIEIVKQPSHYIGVENIDFNFLGFDLRWITIEDGGLSILVPIIAGLSALIFCIGQNIMNVLQAEQSKANKYGMMAFSVGLSVYLGTFVTAAVALYWTVGNLWGVLQQYLMNLAINPRKYVNYQELEATRAELKELQNLSKNNKRAKEQIKKEKADYKKFFSITNKHLVFYSESNGFYKYYKGIIEYILENTNLTIHYITSDYHDAIFDLAKKEPKIKPYYIEEKKLITLMMKMDADVVAMTMPDIENFHIKRSYVRKDIEYVYIPHGIGSSNLLLRKNAVDHYDSILTVGEFQRKEYEKENQLRHLKNRKLIDFGYPLLDDMIADYQKSKHTSSKTKTIMIAPSWQKDNIIDLCLEEMLEALSDKDYKIIVRPHPQQVRHMKDAFKKMKEKYQNTNSTIDIDFNSSSNSIFNSDLLITDWSAINLEYAFTTGRPVISVNTPMKIMNPDYKKLGIEPFNISCRKIIGETIDVKDIKNIDKTIEKILKNTKKYQEQIFDLRDKSVYNIGNSATIGGKFIIDCIQSKIKERKANE